MNNEVISTTHKNVTLTTLYNCFLIIYKFQLQHIEVLILVYISNLVVTFIQENHLLIEWTCPFGRPPAAIKLTK